MCTRDGKTGSVWLSLRATFYTYTLICHRETQFYEKPSLVWWKTSDGNLMEKCNEKSLMDKFPLKTYLFHALYANMGNSNFHIWNYLNLQIFQEIKRNCTIGFQILSQMLHLLGHWASWCFKEMIVIQYKITGSDWFYHFHKLLRLTFSITKVHQTDFFH